MAAETVLKLDKSPRRRRRVPLSLRLFVLILIIGGVISVAVVGPRAYRNWRAIQEIRRVGGWHDRKRHTPTQLQKRLGDKATIAFDEIPAVFLDGSEIDDAGLVHVARLTSLLELGLNLTQVTDAGLAHLTGLSDLKYLGLSGTQVTDAGLVHVAGLRNLTRLNLAGTQVTDAGLVHLSGLSKLQYLTLINTKVSNAGVAELKRALPNTIIYHEQPAARTSE
jgi:hypothetical protein